MKSIFRFMAASISLWNLSAFAGNVKETVEFSEPHFYSDNPEHMAHSPLDLPENKGYVTSCYKNIKFSIENHITAGIVGHACHDIFGQEKLVTMPKGGTLKCKLGAVLVEHQGSYQMYADMHGVFTPSQGEPHEFPKRSVPLGKPFTTIKDFDGHGDGRCVVFDKVLAELRDSPVVADHEQTATNGLK